MNSTCEPAIIISPYTHLAQALAQPGITHVVSILGKSDKLPWPDSGARKTLRLEFDDIHYSSGAWVAPTREHIDRLIEFARQWSYSSYGNLLVHCRAGSSRSPAAAAIVVAAIGRPDLIERVLTAKTYHQPHEGMLRLADRLIQPRPRLVERAGAIRHREDGDSDWRPVAIPLGPKPHD